MFNTAAKIFCAAFIFAGSLAQANDISIKAVSFQDLDGWKDDDLSVALDVFLKSCDQVRGNEFVPKTEWNELCKFARAKPIARSFFEMFFNQF